MTHDEVQGWLTSYVDAWHTYDRAAIVDLFADDALYRYHPYDEPVIGNGAIAELDDRDAPGTWEATYRPFVIEGDNAVATGTTLYRDSSGSPTRQFDNCFTLVFDAGGRCSEFTEWFAERPL